MKDHHTGECRKHLQDYIFSSRSHFSGSQKWRNKSTGLQCLAAPSETAFFILPPQHSSFLPSSVHRTMTWAPVFAVSFFRMFMRKYTVKLCVLGVWMWAGVVCVCTFTTYVWFICVCVPVCTLTQARRGCLVSCSSELYLFSFETGSTTEPGDGLEASTDPPVSEHIPQLSEVTDTSLTGHTQAFR